MFPFSFGLARHSVLPGINIVEVLQKGQVVGSVYPTGRGLHIASRYLFEDPESKVKIDRSNLLPPLPSLLVNFIAGGEAGGAISLPWYKYKVEKPGEVIYVLVDAADGLGLSLAVADITRSEEHSHTESRELYVLVDGWLSVWIDDEDSYLTQSLDFIEIPKNVRHWAETKGDKPARVLVVSKPAWRAEDHHLGVSAD